ncbi:hypothetical protein OPQ81_000723 [Rhizoctonia solani]|nr:hypothetical protein OPQ81_000723 [Rhizoctonia solani]
MYKPNSSVNTLRLFCRYTKEPIVLCHISVPHFQSCRAGDSVFIAPVGTGSLESNLLSLLWPPVLKYDISNIFSFKASCIFS